MFYTPQHKITKHLPMILIMAASTVMTACQTTPTAPVIQRANATYETTGLGISKNKALENALTSAKQTCHNKQIIVIKDNVKYNGLLDEKTGRVVDQAGVIVGTVLGTRTPKIARDDDYEYTINFKCQ